MIEKNEKHAISTENQKSGNDAITNRLEIDIKAFFIPNTNSGCRWDSLIKALRENDVPALQRQLLSRTEDIDGRQFSWNRIQISNLPAGIVDEPGESDGEDGNHNKGNRKKNVKLETLIEAVLRLMDKTKYEFGLDLLDLNAKVLESSDQFWNLLDHPRVRELRISIDVQDCTNMRLLHKISRTPNLTKFRLELKIDNASPTKIETPLYLLTNSKSLEEITVEVVQRPSSSYETKNGASKAYLSERKWIGLCQCIHNSNSTSKLRLLDMKTVRIPNTPASLQNLNDLIEFNERLDVFHVLVPTTEESEEDNENHIKSSGNVETDRHAVKIKKNKDIVHIGKADVETITWIA